MRTNKKGIFINMKNLLLETKKDLEHCIQISIAIFIISALVWICNNIEYAIMVFSILELANIITTIFCIILNIDYYIKEIEKGSDKDGHGKI